MTGQDKLSMNSMNEESNSGFLMNVVTWCLYLVMYAGSAFLQAAVLRILWRWFITPLGVVHVGYFHTFGIMVILYLIKYQLKTEDSASIIQSPTLKVLHRMWMLLGLPLMLMLVGFAVKQLM